jgi:hypothetical protein
MFAGRKVRAPPLPTRILWSWEVEEAPVEVAGGAAPETTGDVDDGAVEEAADDAEEAAAVFIAAALNVAYCSWDVGLMAKTMPCWQWPVWRQYIQTGFVSFTWSWACGKGPLVLFAVTGILEKGVRLVMTQREKGDIQSSIKATRHESTGFGKGGLRHGVILRLKVEDDNIPDVGGLNDSCLSRAKQKRRLQATYHEGRGIRDNPNATDCYLNLDSIRG